MNDSAQTNSNVIVANANNWTPIPYESSEIDEVKRRASGTQNEKFRNVPDEFKNVDFENFKYPAVRLKNGEYDDLDPDNPLSGSQSFSISDILYVDLDIDNKKEAIVMLHAVGCGASCDGGRSIIYIYSSQKGKLKFITEIEMGSRSDGCSLKSFAVTNKKIIIEQFGRCTKKSYIDENKNHSCKFCAKDLTRSIYSIIDSKLTKESSVVIEVPERDVMGYDAEININE